MFRGGGFRAVDSHNGRVVLVKTKGGWPTIASEKVYEFTIEITYL